ncbi:SsgA family sporulation/cell division regulator [Kineosporia sp. J2-2]|uniref:SsgA family sporulation/cell division regulator n=1 Tax=Kineosporia corallincola TaxID=2835133 RepID=A0ABS5TNL0_9ACTN|nr:SsgA family sporulation/cell division regulator [Kineosporia corallincola]MBT0771791.1 SsgA family sporulation/cell division regulator [Kineosporia corallincola]
MSLRKRRMTMPGTVRFADREPRSLTVALVYDAEDPFRVQVGVEAASGFHHWRSISRELLAEGCEQAQTLGMVKIRPDGGSVVLDFCEVVGVATITVSRAQARMFLGQTYRMVAPVIEDPSAGMLPEVEAAVDEAVAAILAGVA